MITLFAMYAFAFGAIIGSFLNVAALRYNTGRSIAGRSSCYSCRHPLSWYELVPLLSFFVQAGVCRHCKSRISWQYPIIEGLTAILFMGGLLKFWPLLETSFLAFLLAYIPFLIISSLLVVILIYDAKHKIIPDGLVYTFIIFSFLLLFVAVDNGNILLAVPHLVDLLAGPFLFLPFFCLWYFSGGKWMGFGDAKLALGMGWFLGLAGGLSAIVISFWIGAAMSLGILFYQKGLSSRRKRLTIKSEIPFAPFLIVGLWLVFFFGWDVVGLKDIITLLT